MPLYFPFYRQRDAMDCGPACLMMLAAAHGRKYPLPYLREKSYLSREGVSAQGIMEAAESIGFRTMTVKVPFDTGSDTACLLNAPLPCIAHWNQNHFVVVYKVEKRKVWVADPDAGKFKLSRADFEKSWLSDADKGILILAEPTPEFYRHEASAPASTARLGHALGYVRPHRRLLLQVVAGMVLASVFTLIFPFLTQSVVDFGIENRNIGFIYLVLVAQLVLFFSQMTVQFLQSRILLFVGTRINVAMVSDFLSKLMRLPIGFFDTKMTGDLLQRISDQARIEAFLTQSALPVLFSIINFVVFGFVLAAYNTLIFSIFFISAAFYVAWILFFLRRRKEIDYVRFRQSGENNNALIELIQGMQEIKLQGSERKRRWIWASIQARLFHTSLMSLNLAQWQESGAGLINQGKNIFIAFLAAKSVVDGQMTLGMMLAVQYMVGQMDAPLQQFIAFIRASQDARISLERMSEIQDQPDEDSLQAFDSAGANALLSANGRSHVAPLFGENHHRQEDIHIEQLCFRYNHLYDDVLHDIDFVIPQGKVTAIVGASGSGKTTLIKLLLGFYRPTKGNIRIGNIPLLQITPSEWRKRCGTVMQDGFIFSDSIANNIAECDDRPDPDRLFRAVQTANIQEFITNLPLGYNTRIGATGNGISQGQRQRLLIARAVYKNPDFLFFDEATNALDANNEKVIVENLQAFYGRPAFSAGSETTPESVNKERKTVVIVAHRLSTVRHADNIAVMDKGKIVETGTHDELASLKGAYYHLVKNQLELGN
ncbi:MAG: peptidase domain-containing ABC transporter [Saprospiraceae bacterium]